MSGVNDPKFIAAVKAVGGQVIDPKPKFLDPTDRYYIIQSNGVALYRDSHHLTTKGAKIMLVPLLHDTLTIKNNNR
jgi:hypothetical protein